jgi:hypothetical protein
MSMLSEITKALRAERRENYEMRLKDQDKSEWREYIANKREPFVLTERSETTGY